MTGRVINYPCGEKIYNKEAVDAVHEQETSERVAADTSLRTDLDNEIAERKALTDDFSERIPAIEAVIPAQATEDNQLADKEFVNSSVQTATANFRGNWRTWSDVPSDSAYYPVDYAGSHVPTVNDYLVIQDASGYDTEYTGTWRFKYTGVWGTAGKDGWEPEYQVNETPLTAEQLAVLDSGITAELVAQITANKTKSEANEAAIAEKQDKLTDAQLANIAAVPNKQNTLAATQTRVIYITSTDPGVGSTLASGAITLVY